MPADRSHNRLLAALSEPAFALWSPLLEWVPLALGQVLQAPGVAVNHVYFPTSALVSLRYGASIDAAVEVAVVGNDSVVGTAGLMGAEQAYSHALVSTAGAGFRLPAAAFRAAIERADEVLRLLLRHTQALIVQISQTAWCHQHHTLPQQLARWMLVRLDRLPADASDLGPPWPGLLPMAEHEAVVAAMASLEGHGAIAWHHDHLRVPDRHRLERLACGCHSLIRRECDGLMA